MRKIPGFFVFIITIAFLLANVRANAQPSYTIGIVVPIEHTALHEIVAGFKETIVANTSQPVVFKVQNAQGDINIQRNIIQQFIHQKVDLIVPIGTATTQMAMNMVTSQPIVSLAANVTAPDRQKAKAKKITGIHDEVEIQTQLLHLKSVFPDLKKMTLIHSHNEKIFAEVETLKQLAKEQNIHLQTLMIQNLPELYTFSKLIDPESSFVYVLKDNLIVSGIKTLTQQAIQHKIPLITSDEGSVKSGAAFALGVSEYAIGERAAHLVIKMLNGTPIEALPFEQLSEVSLFYNPKACQQQGIDLGILKDSAEKHGLKMIAVKEGR